MIGFINSITFKYPVGSTYTAKFDDGNGGIVEQSKEVTQELIDMINEDLQWAKNEVLTFLATL